MSKEDLQLVLEALRNSSQFVFVDPKKGHLREQAINIIKRELGEETSSEEETG